MSGITDEAAIEGHDLIHNAELEEERVRRKGSTWTRHGELTSKQLHQHDNQSEQQPKQTENLGSTSKDETKKESTFDKVKDALHLHK